MTGIDDRELLDQRMELLSEKPKSDLSDIRIIYTEEQVEKLTSIDGLALNKLMNDMYYTTGYDSAGSPISELNPDFNIDASWSEYASKFKGLDDIYATINRQLKEWFEENP